MSYADQIRIEQSAYDMRELIADGIGENKNIADSANIKSDSAVSTANTANDRVNNIITTQNGQTPVEVIDSRHDNISNVTYQNLGERLDNHSSQLADIAKIITVTDGEDITVKLQTEINKKGYVKVYSDTDKTVIISDSILIGNNTTIEFSNCITIQKANNINKPIYKNSDTANGNKNIKLIGGIYDFNRLGNTNYNGHGIVFNNIKNLEYSNIKFTNENKYCSLVCNCANFIANNIEFSTNSDGLHFQPPLTNARLTNIKGITGDDMIAFTLGDYAAYELTNTGDFTNIVIDNVVCVNAKACVKITGSGLNGNNIFKDITIKNLFGTVTEEGIAIINDSNGGNNHLLNTKVFGLIVDTVHLVGASNWTFALNTVDGDMIFNNIKISGNGTDFLLGTMKSFVISNLSLAKITDITSGLKLFSIVGTINTIEINNVDFNNAGGLNNGGFIEYSTTANVRETFINNIFYCGIKGSDTFIKINTGAILSNIYLNNFKITTVGTLFEIRENTPCIYVNNGVVSNINTPVYFSTSGKSLRIVGESNMFVGLAGSGTFSMNSRKIQFTNLMAAITPQTYDMICHTNTNDGTALTGLLVWNGTAWIKLA